MRWCTGVLLALVLGAGCKQTAQQSKPREPSRKVQREKSPEASASIPRVTIDQRGVEEIGSFDRLTPEIFVKITILYRKEMKQWLRTARSLNPGKQQLFFEEANRTFFRTLGITEEEYLRYSERNQEKLNRYLEEHPELLREAME